MQLALAVGFLIGVFVGVFAGVLLLSLCAMAGREDRFLETASSSTK